jgi:hypothetical protein
VTEQADPTAFGMCRSGFVDAMLPPGHRLHVVLQGISRDFAAVNIRMFVHKAAQLEVVPAGER